MPVFDHMGGPPRRQHHRRAAAHHGIGDTPPIRQPRKASGLFHRLTVTPDQRRRYGQKHPHIPKGSLVGSPGFPASRSATPPESKSPAAQKRQFGSTVAHGQTIEKPPP